MCPIMGGIWEYRNFVLGNCNKTNKNDCKVTKAAKIQTENNLKRPILICWQNLYFLQELQSCIAKVVLFINILNNSL